MRIATPKGVGESNAYGPDVGIGSIEVCRDVALPFGQTWRLTVLTNHEEGDIVASYWNIVTENADSLDTGRCFTTLANKRMSLMEW